MDNEKLNFEEALKKLEEITKKLEAGNISLDESLKLYTEGLYLSKFCEKKLNDVEHQIEILQTTDIENFDKINNKQEDKNQQELNTKNKEKKQKNKKTKEESNLLF